MSKILLTGMSGVGKSAALEAMSSEDTLCIDLDDSPWMETESEPGERALYGALDAVIVMTAPLEVMRRRILCRQNPFGKRADEWQRIVQDKCQIEPLLKGNCTYVCDTDRPMAEVLADIRRFLD